ncbi:MAG TPA: glutamate-5-semialdehyde dehydrogenase [Saprospiraceae bacterium]|nr:glutamate-5-semialdehyde dehydrogenase [Saprospiraceae bacterium]
MEVQVLEVEQILKQARKSSKVIAALPELDRNAVLSTLGELLTQHVDYILVKNKMDLDNMPDSDPKKDRLMLNVSRIDGLVQSIHQIIRLADPSGKTTYTHQLDNGLVIEKKSVPLGVVGVIFESRPNVTIDIAALCIKSGNAAVLRGGTDAYHSNSALVEIIGKALTQHGLPTSIVTLFPTDRALVGELLSATKYVDIIIPRGSAGLIQFVRENSKIPTIETGAGVCHTYVSKHANLEQAAAIIVNAKVTRPSVCNSLDTILADQEIVDDLAQKIHSGLADFKVEIFADDIAYTSLKANNYPFLAKASEEDYGREFLDFKCSFKTVAGLDEALDHIENYSSRHSEAIISEDKNEISKFINEVDAAAVYANASTRFTDGGEFGLGAEIGISTQKLHARGPFALEKLTTEKWVAVGNGQVR